MVNPPWFKSSMNVPYLSWYVSSFHHHSKRHILQHKSVPFLCLATTNFQILATCPLWNTYLLLEKNPQLAQECPHSKLKSLTSMFKFNSSFVFLIATFHILLDSDEVCPTRTLQQLTKLFLQIVCGGNAQHYILMVDT